ncbi:MAG: esterase/lipase family protein [Pseudonocardiaceae bacterium]
MQRRPCTDVVVVVPGILGSALAVDGQPVWELSGAALLRGLRTFGKSITRLQLPADVGDGHPGDGVQPIGLMPDLHVLPGLWRPIDGYSGLLRWLEQSFTLTRYDPARPDQPANLVPFAYDWRLSNRYNACRLEETVEPVLSRWRAADPSHASAELVFLCHSMGGLLTRYYLDVRGGAEITRRLLTMGTPYRGAAQALLDLVNGVRKGIGPLRLDLTALARSLPSAHQLLPGYDCVESGPDLMHHRELALDGPDPALLADAEQFHAEIARAVASQGGPSRYRIRAVHGLRQPTPTMVSVQGDQLDTSLSIRGRDEGGDGTVPRLSGHPPELDDEDDALRGHSEQHGSLQTNAAVRDVIWEWLTAEKRPPHRGPAGADTLGVVHPDLLLPGEPLEVAVTAESDALLVSATVTALDSEHAVTRTLRNLGEGRYRTRFEGLDPGLHRVRTHAATGALAVTSHLLVWEDGR